VLTALQFTFHDAVLINEHTAQPIAGWTALPDPEFNQSTLAGEHLGRQLTAVLAGHRAFNPFNYGGNWRAVVFELLGAIGDLHTRASAYVLVVRAFISVLKSPPTTHVISDDHLKIRAATFDVFDQLLECPAPIDAQTTFAFIGVGPNYFETTSHGVVANLVTLVLRGVLLVLSGHPNIFGCSHLWNLGDLYIACLIE
jgi:hypothetical protein